MRVVTVSSLSSQVGQDRDELYLDTSGWDREEEEEEGEGDKEQQDDQEEGRWSRGGDMW